MIQPGEVQSVRELSRGVQARVCLGADARRGSAVITVETTAPEVMEALEALKGALRAEAKRYVGEVVAGQKDWDEVKAS